MPQSFGRDVLSDDCQAQAPPRQPTACPQQRGVGHPRDAPRCSSRTRPACLHRRTWRYGRRSSHPSGILGPGEALRHRRRPTNGVSQLVDDCFRETRPRRRKRTIRVEQRRRRSPQCPLKTPEADPLAERRSLTSWSSSPVAHVRVVHSESAPSPPAYVRAAGSGSVQFDVVKDATSRFVAIRRSHQVVDVVADRRRTSRCRSE